jgi:hypothetical protein
LKTVRRRAAKCGGRREKENERKEEDKEKET